MNPCPRPLLRGLFVRLVALAALIFGGSGNLAAVEDGALVSWRHRGGLSNYSLAVNISQTGAAEVSLQKFEGPPTVYRTTLSARELAGLRVLIQSVDFFAPTELLAFMARGNPASTYSPKYEKYEYERLMPLFQKIVLPKLEQIVEKDGSLEVRQRVTEAAKTIREEIAK